MGAKKNFVLDTNVILHDYKCIHNFEENDIYIPIVVLEELDHFKKGNVITSYSIHYTKLYEEEKQTTTYIAGKQLPAGNSAVKKNSQKKSVTVFIQECKSFLHNSLLHKDGWMPKYIVQSVILGIILGGIAFWNGAAVFAALMVLFMLAIAADRRLEYLITAVITTILS